MGAELRDTSLLRLVLIRQTLNRTKKGRQKTIQRIFHSIVLAMVYQPSYLVWNNKT